MTRAGHASWRDLPVSFFTALALASVLAGVLVASGCTGDDGAGDQRSSADERSTDERQRRYTAPAGLLLGRPVAGQSRDDLGSHTVLRELFALIEATPPGERVRIVAHSFSLVPVAEALVVAHERGVRVQVIVDDNVSGTWDAVQVLRAGLGSDRRSGSFVDLAPGRLHEKTWSFSRAAGAEDIVLIGSMNLTYYSAGQFNDVIAYRDRPDVRRVVDARFEQLLDQLPSPRPRPVVQLGQDRLWFFPLGDAPDPLAAMLAEIPPVGARVRVAMYAWLDERGLALAAQLADLDAAGADVEVVLGRSVGPSVRAVLESSGVEMHEGVYDDRSDIHHKLTVVSHPGAEGARERWVLTGSDNYTEKSLGRPEMLLRPVLSRGDFARYQRWMDRLQRRE